MSRFKEGVSAIRSSYKDWQQWWWGKPWFGGKVSLGGFSNALMGALKWTRMRRLAKNFEWLTDNLESIPDSQLQEIGSYWQVFARNLNARSADFARSLENDTEHFGAGLGSHGRDFAKGLSRNSHLFAAGLGENASDFFTGLGIDESYAFFEALGPEAGAFISALYRPKDGFEAMGRDKLIDLIISLGPNVAAFFDGLQPNQSQLLSYIEEAGLVRVVHGLGLKSAFLLKSLNDKEPVFQAIAESAEDFATILGEQTDAFLNVLGPDCQKLIFTLGPKVSFFIAKSNDPAPIFRFIAAEARSFGASVGDQAAQLAHSLNRHSGLFFECIEGATLIHFMEGLGPHLGFFIRKLFQPERVLMALGRNPQSIFEGFTEEDMLLFAEGMGPQAGSLGQNLKKQARPFAEALGNLAPAFGQGLGRHARVFITNLGGHSPTPPNRDWITGLFYDVVDYFQGNYYSRGFLKGLSPDTREAWFHAISQKTQLRIQARHRLRCSLCHQSLELEEELQQCPACATILHSDCLHELSRGQCPHDGEPARNFLETTLVHEEDYVSPSSSARISRISIPAINPEKA